jgi:hypothetical protein
MTTNANAGTTQPKDQTFFQPDDISRLEKLIDTAPVPARPMRTVDALAALAPALSRARDKGHSLASLMQLCEQQGLRATERAISRAISSARAAKHPRKKLAGTAKAAGG